MARLSWVAPYYRSTQRQPPSVPVMRHLALLDIQYEDDTAHAWLRRLIVETARRL